jgi:hypothetical protein
MWLNKEKAEANASANSMFEQLHFKHLLRLKYLIVLFLQAPSVPHTVL